jgi:RNA polymerase sigma-70 factor (ECF subfamily)
LIEPMTMPSDEGFPEEPPDEELALAGRFVELYRRYADPVFRYCYRRVASREIAEDLTAQIFLKAMNALPSYRTGSFRAWLFTIARNALTDSHRTRRNHAPLETALRLVAPEPNPETLAISAEATAAVRYALRRLPHEQRDVVELRMAGLSTGEIAETLQRTLPAVKSAQYRAFAQLRRALAATRD